MTQSIRRDWNRVDHNLLRFTSFFHLTDKTAQTSTTSNIFTTVMSQLNPNSVQVLYISQSSKIYDETRKIKVKVFNFFFFRFQLLQNHSNQFAEMVLLSQANSAIVDGRRTARTHAVIQCPVIQTIMKNHVHWHQGKFTQYLLTMLEIFN